MNGSRIVIRPDNARSSRPPLWTLHHWAAAAGAIAPTEQEAIDKAYYELMAFLQLHKVDLNGEVWIDSSRAIQESGRTVYAVILKCRVVEQKKDGTPARRALETYRNGR